MFVYFVEQVWTNTEREWNRYPWFPTKEVARQIWEQYHWGSFHSWYPRHEYMWLGEDYIEY